MKTLKKSLIVSGTIRLYLIIWGAFLLGILIAIPFSNTTSEWRYVALAGFFLTLGSFILALSKMYSVQEEIRERYPASVKGEKAFLTGLFYFARSVFLIPGIFILLLTLQREDVVGTDLVEVGGKVSNIEVYGGEYQDLKITFEDNSNEYKTPTFKVPDKNLEQIENEIQPEDFVFILIERDDAQKIQDPYIQIYGIRTKEYVYLSLEEFNQADSANNQIGIILGAVFTFSGSIYLLTGKIKQNAKISYNTV